MMGLLSCIRAAKHNPNLLTLAMGMNLTELGLNLNTPETLHTTFSGPFASRLCRYVYHIFVERIEMIK